MTVMLFGTFDLLHPGHVYFINEARQLGDKLVIIIGRDKNVHNIKGQKPVWDELKRQKELQTTFPDPTVTVILGDLEDFYVPVRAHQPDIIALGYDQKANEDTLRAVMREWTPKPHIVRVDGFRTGEFKSSIMRRKRE